MFGLKLTAQILTEGLWLLVGGPGAKRIQWSCINKTSMQVVEGLIDVGLFLLSAGPSLLLWAAILFFPARWVWKKLRRKVAEPDLPSAG